MKWQEKQPVKVDEIVQLTVLGISGKYRVLRNAGDVLDLRLSDLVLVEADT